MSFLTRLLTAPTAGTTLLLLALTTGCSWSRLPQTLAEQNRPLAYGYTPLDPLPVADVPADAAALSALCDETMRLAVGTVSTDGNITYGPTAVGYSGSNYVIIIDYIKYKTHPFPAKKDSEKVEDKETNIVYKPSRAATPDVVVPLYIGVGVRLSAHITVKRGKVNLGNLFGVGAQAQADNVSGTLVIQTLGISGEGISSAIPVPSELNATTIQNAIMALGTIKAKMYTDKTCISPRAVALYNNLGGGSKTLKYFISTLLQEPIPFEATSQTQRPKPK